MNIQIKFYFFIENLCFCSLKIAVCAPKIPIGRKKIKIPIRLKITIESKNYYLKIIARVRVYACMYARMYSNSHKDKDHDQDQDQDTNGTPPPEKERNTGNAGKPEYICMIADNEKKYKKVKKNLELIKKVVTLLLQSNQTTL